MISFLTLGILMQSQSLESSALQSLKNADSVVTGSSTVELITTFSPKSVGTERLRRA